MNRLVRRSLINLIFISLTLASDSFEDVSQDAERFDRQRVIGGKAANGIDYPWFVSLGACAGSLVAPEFVLTAAHCYSHDIWNRIFVGKVCKRHDNCGSPQERFRIKQTFVHPDYNKSKGSHDFMLIKLNKKSSITPIEMDDGTLSPSYAPGRENLWTAGFGYTDYQRKSRPFRLQHLPLKYVSNDVCNLDYADDDWDVEEDMMCAVNDDPSKQACFGDSGGPLFDKTENKLVGVTSWGDEACLSKTVVYSRISDQIGWITSTICKNHSFPKPDFCKPKTPAPTTSVQPSKSPYPSITPSISFEPSISPPPQRTYFQIVAKTEDETKLCVRGGKIIRLQECNATKEKQLWKADTFGQLRNFSDENYCLTHVKRIFDTRENLKMNLCSNARQALPEIFIFNGFQNSILYIKSDTNWVREGMKAISAKSLAIGAKVTLEWHFYGDFDTDFAQKWDIEYPDMKLPKGTQNRE